MLAFQLLIMHCACVFVFVFVLGLYYIPLQGLGFKIDQADL